MNLLRNKLSINFCCKRNFLFNYIYYNEKLNSSQYYSCLYNSVYAKPWVFQVKSLKQSRTLMSSVRYTLLNLKLKLKQISQDFLGFTSFFFSTNYKYYGFLWYKSLESLNVQEFFTLLQMEDTFYSRFKVLELHVWMLLYYLPRKTRPDEVIRYGLVEAMWEDTQNRAKIIDSDNINFKKNMKSLYEKFKVTLILYDHGYGSDDTMLTNVLWFNFFDNANVDPRFLEALVYYIRHQMNYLSKIDFPTLTSRKEKKGIWLSFRPYIKEVFKNRSLH